jgi:hypothetical protein
VCLVSGAHYTGPKILWKPIVDHRRSDRAQNAKLLSTHRRNSPMLMAFHLGEKLELGGQMVFLHIDFAAILHTGSSQRNFGIWGQAFPQRDASHMLHNCPPIW